MSEMSKKVLEVVIENAGKSAEEIINALSRSFPRESYALLESYIYELRNKDYLSVQSGDNRIVAIGVNPFINHAMLDTLFDEKIAGSFHFTPGACYDECPNGNKSAIHWDLVCIQTPEFGGGEMYLDGELIRKDGLFIPQDLQCLNPDALK